MNDEVVDHRTIDGDEVGLSTWATIDPDKDVVRVVAYGASQIKGPYAASTGTIAKLRR